MSFLYLFVVVRKIGFLKWYLIYSLLKLETSRIILRPQFLCDLKHSILRFWYNTSIWKFYDTIRIYQKCFDISNIFLIFQTSQTLWLITFNVKMSSHCCFYTLHIFCILYYLMMATPAETCFNKCLMLIIKIYSGVIGGFL